MKVAIYYDWLNQWGGAERVLLNLLTLYPEADIYTLAHDPHKTSWIPKHHKITTSFLNSSHPLLTPFFDIAAEKFDFSDYDLVISTTSNVGHCLITPPKTKFVCYYHNINRYLYQNNTWLLKPLLNIYKKIDYVYARRPDVALCNSKTVQTRIKNSLNIDSTVIYPGINTNFFVLPAIKTDKKFFLCVSRMVYHKKIDIAIEACIQTKQPLVIIGEGRLLKNYQRKYKHPLIKFMGQVSDNILLNCYQNAKALICPQIEDFGLTALEAQACGTPVIAYKNGGLTETVNDGISGIFFKLQTTANLVESLNNFNHMTFDSTVTRNNALLFSDKSFMLNFKINLENYDK